MYSPSLIFLPVLSVADKRIRREVLESHNSFQIRLLKSIDIFFYLNFSYALFYVLKEHHFFQINFLQSLFQQKAGDLKVYLFIVLFNLVLIFLKKTTFLFLAYLFDEIKKYNILIFNLNMFLKIIGLMLFFFTFLFSFNLIENIYYIYFILILNTLLYILLMITGFYKIPHKAFVDYINFILYFCALEIIPLLLVIKYILLQ